MSSACPAAARRSAWRFDIRGHSVYYPFVTAKQKVMEAIRDLPDDASIEDAMQRLLFLAKIDRGLQQADAGQTIPHAQVKEKMAKWLK
jgi:hypothetical protein